MYNKYYPCQYYRSEEIKEPKPPKKKFDFKCLKKNACTSLNDVEYFLNNFSHTLKYIKLINLLK